MVFKFFRSAAPTAPQPAAPHQDVAPAAAGRLDFLGIGAQKSGTTWLHRHLAAHPGVRFPGGKEVHFWDQQLSKGVDWYRGLFAGDHGGAKVGEITPAYGMLDARVVEDIARNFPDVKIIYLMRNPIERAWSAAMHYLKIADMALDEASDQWFIDSFNSAASQLRGDHERCLRVWGSFFPKENILVEEFDRVKTDPLGLLKHVGRHIGVDPDWFDAIPTNELTAPVLEGFGRPVRQSLVPALQEIYGRRIDSLGAYLERDLSHWKTVVGVEPPARPSVDPAAVAAEMARVAAEHGPWTAHNVQVAPGVYTVAPAALNIEEKARRVVRMVGDLMGPDFSKLRILDLGCHEGGFAVELAMQGATVVGVEARAQNIAHAEFARRSLGLENLTFVQADVRELDPATLGTFDVILCLGLLYHLDHEDAVRVLRRMYDLSDHAVIIDTHIALEPREYFDFDGKRYHGVSFREHPDEATTAERMAKGWASVDNTYSFWFTAPSLVNCLTDAGFTTVYRNLSPFTFDFYNRETHERYKYPDREWFVALRGKARTIRAEPLVNEMPVRPVPETFEGRLLPSPLGDLPPFAGEGRPIERP